MMTSKEMQEKSLKARYKKYGGRVGFKKFMQEQAKKGAAKRWNLTKE